MPEEETRLGLLEVRDGTGASVATEQKLKHSETDVLVTDL